MEFAVATILCPNARKSAIRAYKFREKPPKKLVGEGEVPSPSIFFSSLLERSELRK